MKKLRKKFQLKSFQHFKMIWKNFKLKRFNFTLKASKPYNTFLGNKKK